MVVYSFCKWHKLDTIDIEFLVEDIVKEYTKIQDASDGSSMFPGELRNLILRVARTNSEGKLDVCDNQTCMEYCECILPKNYYETECES